MANSQAFWALSSKASSMLIRFLLFRDVSKQHICTNCDDLTMTYLSLEGLFGEDENGKPKGIARSTIARAIEDLLEKGFIRIVRLGGAYQNDKTKYGLVDDWKHWEPGQVIRIKQKGRSGGYDALKKYHDR